MSAPGLWHRETAPVSYGAAGGVCAPDRPNALSTFEVKSDALESLGVICHLRRGVIPGVRPLDRSAAQQIHADLRYEHLLGADDRVRFHPRNSLEVEERRATDAGRNCRRHQ